jgi:hypothetical protein
MAISAASRQFDQAMYMLLGNSEDVVKNAITILGKIVGNIIANPMEEKYRKLPRTNKAFSSKVGNVNGGNQCMTALGFQLRGDDWILEPNPVAWDNLVACQGKIQKFLVKLESQESKPAAEATSSAVPPAAAPVAAPAPAVAPVQPMGGGADAAAMQQFLQAMMLASANSAGAASATANTAPSSDQAAASTDEGKETGEEGSKPDDA